MKRYPGKLEGCADQRIGQVLYEITMNGGCDDEVGSVDELGWYGLIVHRGHGYIVSEDSQGFFDYSCYETKQEAQKAFDGICADYEEFDAAVDA